MNINSGVSRSGKDGILTFAQRVEQGFPDAVQELATMLKVEIQHQLSKPGTGRYYAKVRATEGAKNPAKTATFNRGLRSAVRSLNAGSSLADLRKKFVRNVHRASAPGAPPAPDTGALKRSAFVEQVRGGFIVGVAMAYARWLEFGTPRIKPRPFMRPAGTIVQQKAGVSLQKSLDEFSATRGGAK